MRRRRGATPAQWYARHMYSDDESANEDFEDDPEFNPDDNDDGLGPDDDDANDDPDDPLGAQPDWADFDQFDDRNSDSSRNSSTDSGDSDGHNLDGGLDGMNVYNFNDANDDNIGATLPSPPTTGDNVVSVPLEITVPAHPPTVPHGEGCSTRTENIQPLEDITHDGTSLQIPCEPLPMEIDTPFTVNTSSTHTTGIGATLLSLSQSRRNGQARTTGPPIARPNTRLRLRAENTQPPSPIDDPNSLTTQGIGIINTRARGQKRHSCRAPRPFVGLNDDTRPVLDANGIRDASGSRPTKKLVTSNHGALILRAVSPGPDDDISSNGSSPSRAEAPNDDDFQG
jgi:hypothetical protein